MLDRYCGNCGYSYKENETSCPQCGQIRTTVDNNSPYYDRVVSPQFEELESGINFDPYLGIQSVNTSKGLKSKTTAGILAILLGAYGAHKFYLGYIGTGFIMLAITLVCFSSLIFAAVPSIITIIEGVRYLRMSKEDFYLLYEVNKKHWF